MSNLAEITPDEAMLGFITWLKMGQPFGCDIQQTLSGGTVIHGNIAFASCFQLGIVAQTQTLFLAFDPALWWFPGVWDELCIDPANVILQVTGESPAILVLPGDMPAANSVLVNWIQGNDVQRCLLTPFAQPYLDTLRRGPAAMPAAVSDEAELALELAAFVPLAEEIAW